MNQSISCIITDDEPYARKGLQAYVAKTRFLDLKGECEDAMELGQMLEKQPVDLLFLDIQMPHINGVEFLRSCINPPKVIFTTAFKEYAVEGFELDVLDYMLKPISYERFLKAANKARDYFDLLHDKNEPAYLFVKADGRLEKVVFEEIQFLEAMQNYVIIHTPAKKIITHSTFKALAERLPKRGFFQTHKSFIVAINKVNAVEGNMLLVAGKQVPISRHLRDRVLQVIVN